MFLQDRGGPVWSGQGSPGIIRLVPGWPEKRAPSGSDLGYAVIAARSPGDLEGLCPAAELGLLRQGRRPSRPGLLWGVSGGLVYVRPWPEAVAYHQRAAGGPEAARSRNREAARLARELAGYGIHSVPRKGDLTLSLPDARRALALIRGSAGKPSRTQGFGNSA